MAFADGGVFGTVKNIIIIIVFVNSSWRESTASTITYVGPASVHTHTHTHAKTNISIKAPVECNHINGTQVKTGRQADKLETILLASQSLQDRNDIVPFLFDFSPSRCNSLYSDSVD